jgi:tight adherence protein C
MHPSALLLLAVLGLLVATVRFRALIVRGITRGRLLDYTARDEAPSEPVEVGERGPLSRWLALAGYRSPRAAERFFGITAALFVVGVVFLIALRWSGIIRAAITGLESIPGAVSELFLPVIQGGPWFVLVLLVSSPWLVVRSSRRRIVTEVECDLPLVLELLATLSEAGIGFDSAIERVVAAQPTDRPLSAELRAFQRETLSGRPRVAALRRMSRRLDVPSLTIFISAVVQAEQIGSGVADVFRRQADDARDRRRDRALNLAQSLPVKLLFPLVICFLPAIFVVTLGPIFLQFFKLAETLMNRGTVQ